MSHYNQLTTIERGRIESFIQLGLSFHEIATRLNRSVSTISREVHRCNKEYKALAAQKDYLKKRKACRRPRILRTLNCEVLLLVPSKTIIGRLNKSSETTNVLKAQAHSASSQSIAKYTEITLVCQEVMVREASRVNCVTEVKQDIRKVISRNEERSRFHTSWLRGRQRPTCVLDSVTGSLILSLAETAATFWLL